MKDKTKMFLKWLKDKEVYEQYKENFINYSKHKSFLRFTSKFRIDDYLMNCFCWDNTSQGEDYWCSLYREWVSFLKEKEII